jgi:hypothetical protein
VSAARAAARDALLVWQRHADLAGVRDAEAIGKLESAEQAAWRELWRDVANLLRRLEGDAK